MELKDFCTEEGENYSIIRPEKSSMWKDDFHQFDIIYTTFSKMKDPTTEDIKEQFFEKVLGKNKAEVKRYIEERCREEWPKYSFEWEKNAYQSYELDGENIFVLIDETRQKKFSIDAVIFNRGK